MEKKADCEKAIRDLTTKWMKTQPDQRNPNWHPSFIEFRDWLNANGYGHFLNFRSVMGAPEDAEHWFNQELKQTWRD